MGSHSDSARERIIDAAEQVVVESGARHLTLEAVATRAGVSRGGLLYHFPDKEALLKAMMNRRVDAITESMRLKRTRLPESPEREVLAYVLTFLDEDASSRRVNAAVLASAAHNPDLLAPLREDYRRCMETFTTNGLDFSRAAVVALAIDGLRFLEILSLSPFTEEERRRIVDELLSLAKQANPPAPLPSADPLKG